MALPSFHCVDSLTETACAIRGRASNRMTIDANAILNEVASATRPMIGGPARNPAYPMVATAAMPVPDGIPGKLPAAVKAIGMILARPRPMIR